MLALPLAAALALPAGAAASWSPARTFGAKHLGPGQVAVNGRGDVAVLWQSRAPAQLRVTLLPARGGASTRVLAKGTLSGTIALDERGGATAAWTVGTRLYAANGPLDGRWSAARPIARNSFGPVLAVSRQRRVLLGWTNLSKYGPGEHRDRLAHAGPRVLEAGTAHPPGADADAGGGAAERPACDVRSLRARLPVGPVRRRRARAPSREPCWRWAFRRQQRRSRST